MNDLPRRTLRELLARHGASLARDARRCEGLLRDHCGEYRREVAVLVMALEERVPEELLAAPAGSPREALIARLARRLCDDLGLSEEAARWAVGSWALALGTITDEALEDIERRRPSQAAPIQEAPEAQASQSPEVKDEGAAAVVVVVSADGGGDFESIGAALRAAAPGALIRVRPGLYEEGLVIDKRVAVVGDGPADKIVVRSGDASCVRASAEGASVRGLTLRGVAGAGDGFFTVEVSGGDLVLEDCDVSSETLSCVAVHGAETAPTLRRCRVHDGADSGLYFFDGAEGLVEDCEVSACANVGVALTGGADPTVRRTRVHGGRSAGVASWGGGLGTLEDCEVYENRLAGVGVSEGARLTARGCRVRDGANTGVFVHRGGDAVLEDCAVSGHREGEIAVESSGQLTALRCTVGDGGGAGVIVRDGGQALVEECAVRSNAGAGVLVSAGSLAVVRACRVNSNAGAGIRIDAGGAARVSANDLTGNRAGAFDVEEGGFVEGNDNEE